MIFGAHWSASLAELLSSRPVREAVSKRPSELDVVALTFSGRRERQRQVDLRKFKASLIYM